MLKVCWSVSLHSFVWWFFFVWERQPFDYDYFSECLSEAESEWTVFSLDSLSLSPHLTEVTYSVLDSASGHFEQRSYRDGGHKLGSGGFGEVFYCKLEIGGRETEVAVKALLTKVTTVWCQSDVIHVKFSNIRTCVKVAASVSNAIQDYVEDNNIFWLKMSKQRVCV